MPQSNPKRIAHLEKVTVYVAAINIPCATNKTGLLEVVFTNIEGGERESIPCKYVGGGGALLHKEIQRYL